MPVTVTGDNVSAVLRALEREGAAISVRRVANGWHAVIDVGLPPVPWERFQQRYDGVDYDHRKLRAEFVTGSASVVVGAVSEALDEYARVAAELARLAEQTLREER
jgi:hypothetical protein